MSYTYINRKLEEFNKSIENKKIAIIGIGVSNIPLVEYFSKHNANVTVFDRKTLDKLDEKAIETIKKYNIENDSLKSITLDNGKTLLASGVFLAIGWIPNSELFDVEKDHGYIIVDKNYHTSIDMRTNRDFLPIFHH